MKKKDLKLPREFPGGIWYGKEEQEAILKVVKNQSPFRYYGPNCVFEAREFEFEFARYIISRPGEDWPIESNFFVTAINSGTGALEVALDALGVGIGDEVAVQGFMWISTISSVVRNHAIPLLIDSDDTLNMDPDDLKKKITDRTKVVIPVSMAGGCARIGKIMEIVREINAERKNRDVPILRVLEDCAQSIGALNYGIPGSIDPIGENDRHRIGTFGDMAIFSLQLNKNITCGEGGIIITRDKSLHQRVQAIHDVGFIRDSKGTGNIESGEEQVLVWGQGRRFTELQAALARVQLKKLDLIINHMRKSHDKIESYLKSKSNMTVRSRADSKDPGDTGYFVIFHFPKNNDEEEQIKLGRSIALALNNEGLPSVFLHDYEVHIYYNIYQLVNKIPINNGAPWNHPKNEFHMKYSYKRGASPRLDDYLIRTIGFNIPSLLTDEHESKIIEILDKIHERFIKNL